MADRSEPKASGGADSRHPLFCLVTGIEGSRAFGQSREPRELPIVDFRLNKAIRIGIVWADLLLLPTRIYSGERKIGCITAMPIRRCTQRKGQPFIRSAQ